MRDLVLTLGVVDLLFRAGVTPQFQNPQRQARVLALGDVGRAAKLLADAGDQPFGWRRCPRFAVEAVVELPEAFFRSSSESSAPRLITYCHSA